MIPITILSALVVAPVLLALIFRVHAMYVFISIAVGYFLQAALSDDVDLAIATIVQGSDSMLIARFVLLLTPVLLTLIVLKKSAGKTVLLQLVPLLFSGLFLAAISLPLLPPATEQAIYDSAYGGNIKGAQDLVIAAAMISNLLLTWSLFRHPKEHGKHH